MSSVQIMQKYTILILVKNNRSDTADPYDEKTYYKKTKNSNQRNYNNATSLSLLFIISMTGVVVHSNPCACLFEDFLKN